MEDLIYILLGLLWLVFTFYSQNKKRKEKQLKAEQQQEQEEDSSKSILEDIFGNMEEEPKKIEVIEPAPRSKTFKKNFEDQYKDLGIDSVEKTGKNYHTKAVNPIKETSILKQNIIEKQEIVSKINKIRSFNGKSKKGNNNFDLRKALIYQAIMDTPYI